MPAPSIMAALVNGIGIGLEDILRKADLGNEHGMAAVADHGIGEPARESSEQQPVGFLDGAADLASIVRGAGSSAARRAV